jgi:hypothetical protein
LNFDITDHPWGGSAPLDAGTATPTSAKESAKSPAKAAP